jgi:hypothetical protein
MLVERSLRARSVAEHLLDFVSAEVIDVQEVMPTA